MVGAPNDRIEINDAFRMLLAASPSHEGHKARRLLEDAIYDGSVALWYVYDVEYDVEVRRAYPDFCEDHLMITAKSDDQRGVDGRIGDDAGNH